MNLPARGLPRPVGGLGKLKLGKEAGAAKVDAASANAKRAKEDILCWYEYELFLERLGCRRMDYRLI